MPRRAALSAVAGLALLLPSACGGEDDKGQVRDALQRLQKATAEQDYQQICDKLLSKDLVRRVQAIGVTCPVALRTGLGSVRDPKVQIRQIKIRDKTALALVRSSATGQQASEDTVRLVKEGGSWKIASLSGPQPPTPRRQGPPQDD
jgi:hypothetical protein